MAMVAGPPQRSALGAGSTQHREGKLDGSGRLKRSVGEVTVIPACNRKHPHKVKGDCNRHGDPTGSHPYHTEAHEMDCDNRDAPKPIHLRDAVGFHVLQAGPGIKPS
jgi:hypothetical protein